MPQTTYAEFCLWCIELDNREYQVQTELIFQRPYYELS